jgi:hypothetical protein
MSAQEERRGTARIFFLAARQLRRPLALAALWLAGCASAFSYFPEKTLDPFKVEWYTGQLAAAGEPVISPTGSDRREVLRFSWIPTFDPTLTVRVVRKGPKVTMVAKRLSGAGGYQPGTLDREIKRSVSLRDWDRLMGMLDQADFWNMPSDEPLLKCDSEGHCSIGADGSQWVLEVADSSRYHVVDRWYFGDYPEFESLCLCLLERSGFVSATELESYGESRRAPDWCGRGG